MRLLPIQILLAAVGAVGLYAPITMLISACSVMLAGGSTIRCGKYLGGNERDRVQNLFPLNLLVSTLLAARFTALFLLL